MRVAIGGEYFEDSALDIQDRDIESAAAQVVHGNLALGRLLQSVGEGRGRRLVQQANDFESRQTPGIACGLALSVVEIGGHGDHHPLNQFTAEDSFGALLQ